MQFYLFLITFFTSLLILIYFNIGYIDIGLTKDFQPKLKYQKDLHLPLWKFSQNRKKHQILNKIKNLTSEALELSNTSLHPTEKKILSMFLKLPKIPHQSNFQNSLICINFNYPHYVNIKLIHEMYDNVFGKVIICGPKESPKKDVDIIVKHNNGYFGYHCLAKAMQIYHNYEGYLFGNDDMIINWWKLTDFSKTKIWLGSNNLNCKQKAFKPITVHWPWWKRYVGMSACENFYKSILTLNSNHTFNQDVLANYFKSCDAEPCCCKRYSDLFYIPKRLKDEFTVLSTIAFEHKLFLEIAVPTILVMLDLQRNFETLGGAYVGRHNLEIFGERYNFDITFIHPFKYDPKTKIGNISRNIVKRYIIKYTAICLLN